MIAPAHGCASPMSDPEDPDDEDCGGTSAALAGRAVGRLLPHEPSSVAAVDEEIQTSRPG